MIGSEHHRQPAAVATQHRMGVTHIGHVDCTASTAPYAVTGWGMVCTTRKSGTGIIVTNSLMIVIALLDDSPGIAR